MPSAVVKQSVTSKSMDLLSDKESSLTHILTILNKPKQPLLMDVWSSFQGADGLRGKLKKDFHDLVERRCQEQVQNRRGQKEKRLMRDLHDQQLKHDSDRKNWLAERDGLGKRSLLFSRLPFSTRSSGR